MGTRLDCRAVLSPEQRELQEVTEVDRTDGTGLPCCGGKHVSLSTMGAKEDAGSPGKGHCHNLGVG